MKTMRLAGVGHGAINLQHSSLRAQRGNPAVHAQIWIAAALRTS